MWGRRGCGEGETAVQLAGHEHEHEHPRVHTHADELACHDLSAA